jgi:membrane associated rhomboid family serine protease
MNNVHGIGGPRGGGGQPQSEPSCMDKVKEMWGYVPFFWRIIIYLNLFVYIGSFFYLGILLYAINIPQYVVFKMQIWRIVTSPYAHLDILSLLIGLLVYLMRGYQIEKTKGTAKFAVYFISLSIVVNILATAIGIIGKQLLTNCIASILLSFPCYVAGLWPMILVDMTVDSLKDPNREMMFWWCPFPIKARYYPYIFLVLFGVMSPPIFVGILWGYITGVLYSNGALNFLNPSDNWINKLHSVVFKPFQNNSAYISPSAAIGEDQQAFSIFSRGSFPAPGHPSSSSSPATSQPQPQFSAFAGRGVSISTSAGSGMYGYQGNVANNNSQNQNIRNVPSGPNPLTQQSKIVKEHNKKNPPPQEDEDGDLEIKGDSSSQLSKGEDEDVDLLK